MPHPSKNHPEYIHSTAQQLMTQIKFKTKTNKTKTNKFDHTTWKQTTECNKIIQTHLLILSHRTRIKVTRRKRNKRPATQRKLSAKSLDLELWNSAVGKHKTCTRLSTNTTQPNENKTKSQDSITRLRLSKLKKNQTQQPHSTKKIGYRTTAAKQEIRRGFVIQNSVQTRELSKTQTNPTIN